MTFAAYTSTNIGTISCMNQPTTSGLPRSISVRSGGDSLAVVFGGSSASCGLSAGVGVAVPEAEVARARSNCVKVLAAIKGEPPAGSRRTLTAVMSSASTRISRFSGEDP